MSALPDCRMQGGICACRSGGSYSGCVRVRESCCSASPAAPVVAEGLTDTQISERVEQARLATDSHCDGLAFEPSKEYSDAYFYRYLAAHPVAGSPAESIKQLMKFYSVSTLEGLVDMQAKHVERLQAKLPTAQQPAFTRVREG